MRTGSEGTRLVFLRGNSGSGKSTVAGLVRERYGARDMAVIGQDVVRRTVLKEKESGCSGHVTVGMVDVMARYALAAGSTWWSRGSTVPGGTGRCSGLWLRTMSG
ncbi:hypothetical protein [Streptomyces sp. NPDC056191]|uniref:hypothetical protein n=1 Tax=Streptomyces sp. NPDC056191 TaxID=3345742 RepID=UPI0035D84F93